MFTFVVDYYVTERGIEFRLFFSLLRVGCVLFSDILDVRYGGSMRDWWGTWNLSNRMLSKRVFLQKKSGSIWRKAWLTPRDPDEFIRVVRQRAGLSPESERRD